MEPNKTDVLNYLDNNGPAPARYAHVTIDHRATAEPYYQDLIVGPLPLNNATIKYEPLTYPYTRKTEGRIRNLDASLDESWNSFLYNITASVLDITLDLWNGSALGLDNDTLDVWGIDPLNQEDGIIRWDVFWNNPLTDFDSGTLLPLGLYFKTNVTGRDPTKWTHEGWLYNDIFYPTTEAFRAAYWKPGFEKLPANIDGSWGWTDQEGAPPPLDTDFTPMSIAPSGSRYFADAEQQYVKWMDFEFYVSFSRDVGMHLHDIKYKGERIIYELGLQEALAHYAGNDPVQSGTAYLDTFYGFGSYAFELVKGYDCPSYATYLNTTFYTAETTHTHIDSICLFETEANYPIQRHSTSQYVSATKNVFFTIRTVCTVGNYDYMFSYEFYIDGSINIVVRASGYIQSAYFAKNTEYGYQIHDALSGSMHDHVLNFKIDFDILGTANTMMTTSNVAVSEVYPWSDGKIRNTMKLQRSRIENEDEGKLNWAANGATQFAVVNTDKKNIYGEYRGYRILPSSPTIHLTVEDSSNLKNAANWAKHDLYVTQQHDTEPRASHPYQSQDVVNPPVNFDGFFNSESLLQEDIVVWANLGMHHVPHTGDLPNTVFTTAHSGIQIMPLNYLLNSPVKESVNMVRVNYGDGASSQVTNFGQGSPSCGIPDLAALVPDLADYLGDTVVRKFPYDPNDPYYETDSIE
jgi:primary-amine oxidase